MDPNISKEITEYTDEATEPMGELCEDHLYPKGILGDPHLAHMIASSVPSIRDLCRSSDLQNDASRYS